MIVTAAAVESYRFFASGNRFVPPFDLEGKPAEQLLCFGIHAARPFSRLQKLHSMVGAALLEVANHVRPVCRSESRQAEGQEKQNED
jgi:hypothetical protein